MQYVLQVGPLLACCGRTSILQTIHLQSYISSHSPSATLTLLFQWRLTVPFIRYCTHNKKPLLLMLTLF